MGLNRKLDYSLIHLVMKVKPYLFINIVLTKAKLLQLKLIQIFAKAILLMTKLEIEKTKSTFIISVLKVEY